MYGLRIVDRVDMGLHQYKSDLKNGSVTPKVDVLL
jgi:hypothetical protein